MMSVEFESIDIMCCHPFSIMTNRGSDLTDIFNSMKFGLKRRNEAVKRSIAKAEKAHPIRIAVTLNKA